MIILNSVFIHDIHDSQLRKYLNTEVYVTCGRLALQEQAQVKWPSEKSHVRAEVMSHIC